MLTTTNQPMSANDSGRTQQDKQGEWSADLCDCFGDCEDFLCAFLCPTCYLNTIHARANEGCCSCMFASLAQLRTKVRVERGIHVSQCFMFFDFANFLWFMRLFFQKGSLCSDVCVAFWCPFCAMVQIGVELKRTNSRI
jgi:Cys-rich protein (TIGR01571 family)